MDAHGFRPTTITGDYLSHACPTGASSLSAIGSTSVLTGITFVPVFTYQHPPCESIDSISSPLFGGPSTPLCTVTVSHPFHLHHSRIPCQYQNTANERYKYSNSYLSQQSAEIYLNKLCNSSGVFKGGAEEEGWFEVRTRNVDDNEGKSSNDEKDQKSEGKTFTTTRYKMNVSFEVLNDDGNYMDACVLGLSKSLASAKFPGTTLHLPINFLPISVSCAILPPKSRKSSDGEKPLVKIDPGIKEENEAMEEGGGGVMRVVVPCYSFVSSGSKSASGKGKDEIVLLDLFGGRGLKVRVMKDIINVARKRVKEVEPALSIEENNKGKS